MDHEESMLVGRPRLEVFGRTPGRATFERRGGREVVG
jgi:hypothetical protein